MQYFEQICQNLILWTRIVMKIKFVSILCVSLTVFYYGCVYQTITQSASEPSCPDNLVNGENQMNSVYLRDVNTGHEKQVIQLYTVSPTVSYNIGVYYYPWYFNDFHSGHYLRKHLVPPQEPTLGDYNERNENVITQHLKWSRYANINFWVTSWWGPGSREDVTILNHILKYPDLGDFKIAVFYETEGRTSGFTDYSNLGADITYLVVPEKVYNFQKKLVNVTF